MDQWESRGSHHFQTDILKQGYRLPFKNHPKLSRSPCVINEYRDTSKDGALSNSIEELLTKNTIEKAGKTRQLGILKPFVSSSKTREPLEASHRPKFAQPVLKRAKIQDGDSRINQILPQKGRMDHLHRPHGCLSSHPYPPTVQEVPQIPR